MMQIIYVVMELNYPEPWEKGKIQSFNILNAIVHKKSDEFITMQKAIDAL